MTLFDRKTKAWIRTVEAQLRTDRKHTVFAVPASHCSEELFRMLDDFDHVLENGKILKNSPTTTASLAELAGQKVFLKRTNNKNWKFTLRYLFRPARAFRSAVAAERLERIGIPTPPVLAAGERRCGLILKCGYLVTGSEAGISGMNTVIESSEDPCHAMTAFLGKAAVMMALLHRNHVVHGDLKLTNFYQNAGGEYGIWDLDSVKCYSKKIPQRQIENELTRLLASCVATLRVTGNAPTEAEIAALVKDFCENYGKNSFFVPSDTAVTELVYAKLKRWSAKR